MEVPPRREPLPVPGPPRTPRRRLAIGWVLLGVMIVLLALVILVAVFARNEVTKKAWVKAEPSSHIWTARLPSDLGAGTHCIAVRVVDEYGREHHDHLIVEVIAS